MTMPKDAAHANGCVKLGVCYIAFAVEQPEAFRLIFGQSGLYIDEPQYTETARVAFDRLVDAVVAAMWYKKRGNPQAEHRMRHAWFVVHGYAMLWLGGALANTLNVPSNPSAVLDDARHFLAQGAPLDARGCRADV